MSNFSNTPDQRAGLFDLVLSLFSGDTKGHLPEPSVDPSGEMFQALTRFIGGVVIDEPIRWGDSSLTPPTSTSHTQQVQYITSTLHSVEPSPDGLLILTLIHCRETLQSGASRWFGSYVVGVVPGKPAYSGHGELLLPSDCGRLRISRPG
jgi:hypothetical protein